MVTRKKVEKEEEFLEEEFDSEEGQDVVEDEEEEIEEEEAGVDKDEELGAMGESRLDEPVEELPAEPRGPDPLVKETFQMTSDVPVQVVVVMGKKTVSVKELAEMKMGQVIELARPVNEMVDIIAGGKLVAKGELVDIDGKMGVRVVKLVR